MQANSRAIVSNQEGIHKDLESIVLKHKNSQFLKPIAEHSRQAFEQICQFVQFSDVDKTVSKPIIFDACCGVGESSRQLAQKFPDHCVIGVDKSADRLNRQGREDYPNLMLLRADLNDLYRLLVDSQMPISQHKIYYPNPWPKSQHIKRRWHGAPVFKQIVQLCPNIELRSNWLIYLQEFQAGLTLYSIKSQLSTIENPLPAITPFEAKYHASGQTLYCLQTL
ncbi:methyltransferase [Catenovulum agarivorans DS-2]|uniref:tRNA (guanine(46)-N(7))-methyltransferase n=1 Tax=Catenovulum agarivorans DS-2 TaxID=1328313 RepID=W7Q9E4_9ALTE|nr:hypothetical protein [Catenovulum agarivorans]EWH09444.1 methyltransferase [Catenovulum agarivorans DS-2]